MRRSKGNALRMSTAQPGQQVVGNLPQSWPVEEWHAHYWTVTPTGKLVAGRAIVLLPDGYASACPEVSIGQRGCIAHVRRWGVACQMAILEEIGFDPATIAASEGQETDDQDILYWMIQATHFDLPGDFIIASEEHPFLLFAPDGSLAGSYTRWYTYLGALAYYVSDGRVAGTFGQLWAEDRALYQKAVSYLLDALGGKNDTQAISPLLGRFV